MKRREGFVSNSSSASFVIKKKNITDRQVEQIKNYQKEAWDIGEYDKIIKNPDHSMIDGEFGYIDEFWEIRETTKEIEGHTYMDNFDFYKYLVAIGIKNEYIKWEADN